jgi:hypothetical protein
MIQQSAPVHHEIGEGRPDRRADHDVGRIADQGGGAADVGGKNDGE